MTVYCVFSLESPHWGESKEYKKYNIFSIKKKITLNYPKYAAKGFFLKDSSSSHWSFTAICYIYMK